MGKSAPRRTLTVEIDASLAAAYKEAYDRARAFGSEVTRQQPLDDFIAGFVEDRLAEELAFAEDEAPRKRQ
jgi:hypothetical protein